MRMSAPSAPGPRLTAVQALDGHRVTVTFDDGLAGVLDLAEFLEGPVFAPLLDAALFAQVQVHPLCRTLCWPNGADLDPDVLHARLLATV
jgi:hypothetical protein